MPVTINSGENEKFKHHSAPFETVVIKSNNVTEANQLNKYITLGADQFFLAPQNKKLHPRPIPQFLVGSLVFIEENGDIKYAGMVTDIVENQLIPSIEINAIRMKNPVHIPKIFTGVFGYLFKGAGEDIGFTGSIYKIKQSQAAMIRSETGEFIPEEIFEIFWSEEERRQLEIRVAEEKRYVDAANAFIHHKAG